MMPGPAPVDLTMFEAALALGAEYKVEPLIVITIFNRLLPIATNLAVVVADKVQEIKSSVRFQRIEKEDEVKRLYNTVGFTAKEALNRAGMEWREWTPEGSSNIQWVYTLNKKITNN